MSKVLVYFDVSFCFIRRFENWTKKRKNVGYIWEFPQKIKQENGFSLPEQRERLETFCKFKGYEIVDYYKDAGISAKTGNYRAEIVKIW